MSDTLKENGRVLLFLASLFGTFYSFFDKNFSAMIICFCILIISIILLIKASLEKKKKKHADELQAYQMKINNQIPIFTALVFHNSGLPIAMNSSCRLTIFKNMIYFNSGSMEFKIPMERVISMDIATKSQVEYIQKQSLSRAVAGGLLFGDIGILLGGMPKSKTVEITESFLVITYSKEETVQFITLSNLDCNKALSEVSQYIQFQRKSIEL